MDGDDAYAGGGSNSLGGLFQKKPQTTSNAALTYQREKQPAKSAPAAADTAMALVHHVQANLYKYNEDYDLVGRAIVGLMGNKLHHYKLISYQKPENILIDLPLAPEFKFAIQNDVYASFYDAHRQNWSIQFDSSDVAEKFAGVVRELCKRVPALEVHDIQVGDGDFEALAGDKLALHYTGWLEKTHGSKEKGQIFDSNAGAKEFIVTLGEGKVIKGWEQGLLGMRKGGKRHLYVPSRLAYGPQGHDPIPGYANLIFEVELVKAKAGPKHTTAPRARADSLAHQQQPVLPAVSEQPTSVAPAHQESTSPAVEQDPHARALRHAQRFGQPMMLPVHETRSRSDSQADGAFTDRSEHGHSAAVTPVPVTPQSVQIPPQQQPGFQQVQPVQQQHQPIQQQPIVSPQAQMLQQIPPQQVQQAILAPQQIMPGYGAPQAPPGYEYVQTPSGLALQAIQSPQPPHAQFGSVPSTPGSVYGFPTQTGSPQSFFPGHPQHSQHPQHVVPQQLGFPGHPATPAYMPPFGVPADPTPIWMEARQASVHAARGVDEIKEQINSLASQVGSVSVGAKTGFRSAEAIPAGADLVSGLQRLVEDYNKIKIDHQHKSDRAEVLQAKVSELLEKQEKAVEERNKQMQLRAESLEETAQTAGKRLLEIQQQKSTIEIQLANALEQVADTQKALSESKRDRETLADEIFRLRESLEGIIREGSQQKTDLATEITKTTELTQQLKDAKNAQRELQEKFDALTEKFAEEKQTKEKYAAQLADRKKIHADELAQAEKQYEEDKSRSEEEIRKLRESVRRARSEGGQAAAQQINDIERANEEQIRQLQEQHEQTLARIRSEGEQAMLEAAENAAIAAAQATTVSVQEELLPRIAELEAQLQEAVTIANERADQISQLEQAVAEAAEEQAALVQKSRDYVTRLRDQLNEDHTSTVRQMMNRVYHAMNQGIDQEARYFGSTVMAALLKNIKRITKKVLEGEDVAEDTEFETIDPLNDEWVPSTAPLREVVLPIDEPASDIVSAVPATTVTDEEFAERDASTPHVGVSAPSPLEDAVHQQEQEEEPEYEPIPDEPVSESVPEVTQLPEVSEPVSEEVAATLPAEIEESLVSEVITESVQQTAEDTLAERSTVTSSPVMVDDTETIPEESNGDRYQEHVEESAPSLPEVDSASLPEVTSLPAVDTSLPTPVQETTMEAPAVPVVDDIPEAMPELPSVVPTSEPETIPVTPLSQPVEEEELAKPELVKPVVSHMDSKFQDPLGDDGFGDSLSGSLFSDPTAPPKKPTAPAPKPKSKAKTAAKSKVASKFESIEEDDELLGMMSTKPAAVPKFGSSGALFGNEEESLFD